MAKQTIDIGSSPNDGTGDTIRQSFNKVNDNFTEVYPVQTTSDPTVNDDSDSNYQVGKMWINTATEDVFICVDNTVGAAVWAEITQ